MKEFTIKLAGMVCEGCEKRVENALKSMPGVESVTASYINGIVKVNVSKDIRFKDLEEKIEDIGFQVKEN